VWTLSLTLHPGTRIARGAAVKGGRRGGIDRENPVLQPGLHALGQDGVGGGEVGGLREILGEIVQFNFASTVCAAELVAVANQHRVERPIKMEPGPGPLNGPLAAIKQYSLDGAALNASRQRLG